MGRKCRKIHKTAPSHWGTWTPSNTSMPGHWCIRWGSTHSPHSPPQTPARSLYALTHSYATKAPLVTGRPKFIPKTAPYSSTITTPSNTPIPWPTALTTPNGIRIHSAVLPQYTLRTDRQTDGPGESSVPWALRSLCDALKTELGPIDRKCLPLGYTAAWVTLFLSPPPLFCIDVYQHSWSHLRMTLNKRSLHTEGKLISLIKNDIIVQLQPHQSE